MNKIFIKYIILLFFLTEINIHAQWVDINVPSSGQYVQTLLSFADYLFAGIYADSSCCLFRSSDGGNSWNASNYGLPTSSVSAIISKDNSLFVGLYGKGVFTSIDSGKTWDQCNTGLTDLNIMTLQRVENSIYAVSNRIFRTTNGGINWESLSDIYSGLALTSFAIYDSTFLLGTGGDGIWISTDSCKTWTKKYIPGWSNTVISSIKVVNKKILMGAHSFTFPEGPFYVATFVSEDGGNNWQQILNKEATSFFMSGTEIFMTISNISGELYRTNSNFTSWATFNENLTSLDYLTSIECHGDYIFLGGGTFPGSRYFPKVWHRLLSEVTNVNDNIRIDIPNTVSLLQNYPNPFNPNTRIIYQLPKEGIVSLKLFNVLGDEIETLVNEFKPAGKYEVVFDGSKLTSGVYFYRLKSGSFVETKKMILIK